MTLDTQSSQDVEPLGLRVALEIEAPVATIWLGTGSRRNALRTMDWVHLDRALRLAVSHPEVSLVLLRGVGGTFTAGSDLTEWVAADPGRVEESFRAMEAAIRTTEQADAVTVAAVEGVAAGAGCQLALACDLRLMSVSARIGMPIARHGIRVSPTFARRLMEVVGLARTRDLLLTGRLVDAVRAESWGLVSQVVEDRDFDSELQKLLVSLTDQPRGSLQAAKSSTSRVVERERSDLQDPTWRYVEDELFFDRISKFLAGPASATASPDEDQDESEG